jgi:hypothetical protein
MNHARSQIPPAYTVTLLHLGLAAQLCTTMCVHIRGVSISNPLCCQMCAHLSFAVEVPPEPDPIRAPWWRDVVTGCADLATTRGFMADGGASARESRRVNDRLSFQVTTADSPDWAPREKVCSRTRSIEAVPPSAWCT